MRNKSKKIVLISLTLTFFSVVFIFTIKSKHIDVSENNQYEFLFARYYLEQNSENYNRLYAYLNDHSLESKKIDLQYLDQFHYRKKGNLVIEGIDPKFIQDISIMNQILLFRNGGKKNYNFTLNVASFDKVRNKVNLFYLMKSIISDDKQILKTDISFYQLYKMLGIYFHRIDFVEVSEKIFFDLMLSQKKDVEVLCWYGSTLTKLALFVNSPIEKIEYVNKGIQKIEQAYTLAPNNLTIRLIRSQNYASLPNFFQKTDIAYFMMLELIDDYKNKRNTEVLSYTLSKKLIKIPSKEICILKQFIKENSNLSDEQKEDLMIKTRDIHACQM